LILLPLSAQVCFLLPHSYFSKGKMAYAENQILMTRIAEMDLKFFLTYPYVKWPQDRAWVNHQEVCKVLYHKKNLKFGFI
jgi:hypothetical protein